MPQFSKPACRHCFYFENSFFTSQPVSKFRGEAERLDFETGIEKSSLEKFENEKNELDLMPQDNSLFRDSKTSLDIHMTLTY